MSTATAPVSAATGDGDADSDDPGVGVTPASTAGGSYVVQPGDTLSAIAARAGMSVGDLAAANGLDPNGPLLAGTALNLSGTTASTTAGSSVASAPVSTQSASGGYIVQPGDTLSAIAARSGLSVDQLAADNGLDPNGVLVAGSTIALPGSSVSTASAAGQPIGTAAEGSASGAPYPTPEFVSPSEVGAIASANGVPPSLAEAIGYQESGFNNNEVSTADARGVMQILPGTWDWIQRTLTPNAPLAPASAVDNVRGGVLLLRSLLNSTGSPALAAASYYQGLGSVQKNGLLPETQQYVRDVMGLQARFGGG